MARILIVDDEPDIRKLTGRMLKSAGYDVVEAASGEESLEVIERDKIDLVLLDVAMPGINGWMVCEKIKADERLKHVPVVMFTVFGSEEDVVQGEECGADAYIKKPFDMKELLRIVDELLHKAEYSC
jgi:DNA-binding response OmpR family regulator